ncbi:asparagine synthase-related protein [[Clostridium] hylemonae]|uniref:asparagine synthase (glutamine-hydrolyzing) n=1 Tax=[Clostridium] hylemonae DSM 15053 TaxID=553973 RepID=C0C2D2_9FIRM|nr:asparagine synthase-related protein [[Clostridium] hylemonae]EEG73556.1 asparagine synthase [[Clostridium] hylemonae DSM 15053]QEK17157.1 hypothetical protein LAJLEIBI_01166 [[Clostridium] hylemonae DSM 15053]
MPGIYISNFNNKNNLNNVYPSKCVFEEIPISGYKVYRNTLAKFMDDKVFAQDNDFVLITEGVILNRIELMRKYRQQDFFHTVKEMLKKNGEEFFKEFRGSFCGAVYNKALDEWIVYTNQVGDKSVFYYFENGKFVIGTQVNYILNTLKKNGCPLTFDRKAMYDMLTFAFMEQDSTYAHEIKRLGAGQYIKISKGQLHIYKYFEFLRDDGHLRDLQEEELIDIIDSKFRQAIQREYEKDLEYGYRIYTDLSGGLDSRMTMWVGAEMGYLPMTHLTYCQANYKDELIAKDLADYWGNEIVVKSLNDARFMYDIERIVEMNNGLSLYSGITGGMRLLEMIDSEFMGLEHTGQLGDAVLGSFYKKAEQIGNWELTGMYSEKLKDRISDEYKHTFCDNEMYLLYTRGFQGAMCTHSIRQNYTEVSSPFIDVDFLSFCYNIPAELRVKHNIYIKWILSKYPEAAGFEWEKSGCKLSAGNAEQFIRKVITAGPRKLRKALRITDKISNKGMNPMDYWYKSKCELSRFMDGYFEENICNKVFDKKEKECLESYYKNGTTMEKTQALTVLGAVNYYFGS